MSMFLCARCDALLECDYEDMHQIRGCPDCGAPIELHYDDGYDPDTGEENEHWWSEASDEAPVGMWPRWERGSQR